MSQATVATTPEGIPVIILKEGSSRSYGKDALRINIAAVKAVEEALKSTYGPRGMDKMLVDSLGDVTITNDGATILDKMDLQHPAAKLLVQIAKGQDEETADGTKTAVILSGELVRKAEDLIYKDIHPTIIVSGYKKAEEVALKTIDEIAARVGINDVDILKKVALTSLGSKAVAGAREYLADIVVKAVTQVAELRGDKWYVDLDNIQIVKKHGGSINDTQLVYGIVVDKEVVHPGMPKRSDLGLPSLFRIARNLPLKLAFLDRFAKSALTISILKLFLRFPSQPEKLSVISELLTEFPRSVKCVTSDTKWWFREYELDLSLLRVYEPSAEPFRRASLCLMRLSH